MWTESLFINSVVQLVTVEKYVARRPTDDISCGRPLKLTRTLTFDLLNWKIGKTLAPPLGNVHTNFAFPTLFLFSS